MHFCKIWGISQFTRYFAPPRPTEKKAASHIPATNIPTTAVRLHVFLLLVNLIERKIKIQWEICLHRNFNFKPNLTFYMCFATRPRASLTAVCEYPCQKNTTEISSMID